MARNKVKFKNDMKTAIKSISTDAMAASFSLSLDETLSPEAMTDKIAKKFGEEFADKFADLVPDILDNYLNSLMFDTTKLTANGAPVLGILKVAP